MFERFTDRARRVVVLAQEEARMLSHDYIGTEHLLLGLIQEGEGVAAKALDALGIRLEAVRQQVVEITGRGEHSPSGHIPFTPRAKKVLELSLRESKQLGHNYIGTEHILLGLIREGEGVAALVLRALGADLNRTRQQVIQLLHGYQGREAGGVGAPAGALWGWGRISGRGGRLEDIGGKLDAIAERLAAIEDQLGIGPGPKPEALRQLEQRIEEATAEKEQAINAMDFERAANLRETEKRLIREKDAAEKEWLAGRAPQAGAAPVAAEAAAAGGATAAAEEDRLRQEVERLRALLRGHGIDPGGDPAAGTAAGA
jgi:ATP-dependent Clp protease ATP-binding subunit ClpA